MDTKTNKQLIERYCAAFADGDVDALDGIVAHDVVDHTAYPGQPAGIEGYREFFRVWKMAFPDLSLTVHDMIAEGDRVAYRWTGSGTHLGEFDGLSPTGRTISFDAISISRIQDNRIVEEWFMSDSRQLMNQLQGA